MRLENQMRYRTLQTEEGFHDEQGFTLMETCVSLVVMMIVSLGIASAFTYSINNNTGGGDRALALAVAQQQLERLRNVPFNDASLTATSTSGTSQTVTVPVGDGENRSFTVWTRIDDDTATRKTIQVRVTPLGDSAVWARGSVLLTVQRSAFTLGAYYGGS